MKRITTVKYLLLSLLLGLSVSVSVAEPLDSSVIKTINVRIEEDNLDQFKFTIPYAELSERIAKNLAEWQYPVLVNSATGL